MGFFERQRSLRQKSWRLTLAFVLCVALLVLCVNLALALAWVLSTWPWQDGLQGPWRYPDGFFAVNTGVTLLFVLGGWWIESSRLAQGAQALAQRMGARALRPQQHEAERVLLHVVREMALAAHTPQPAVMLLARNASINAFAASLSLRDSVVVVTQGALEELTRAQLQAMVAHELCHIVEGDAVHNTRLCGMVGGLEMVWDFGRRMLHSEVVLLIAPGMAIAAVGSVGWLAARLLAAAVSRQREYLADARAVQWTRNSEGMSAVLRKISLQQYRYAVADAQLGRSPVDDDPWDMESAQPELIAHMLLVQPPQRRLAHWLDSHPPLAERIARIEEMCCTAET